jgi:hypothetical protein
MNIKPLKRALFVLGMPMFLSGCGDGRQEAPSATPINPTVAPEVLPNTLKVKLRSKTYEITGIGVGGSNRVAIINNQVLKPGMEIDPGVVLKEIQPTYATILIGKKEYQLRPEDIQREMDKKMP